MTPMWTAYTGGPFGSLAMMPSRSGLHPGNVQFAPFFDRLGSCRGDAAVSTWPCHTITDTVRCLNVFAGRLKAVSGSGKGYRTNAQRPQSVCTAATPRTGSEVQTQRRIEDLPRFLPNGVFMHDVEATPTKKRRRIGRREPGTFRRPSLSRPPPGEIACGNCRLTQGMG